MFQPFYPTIKKPPLRSGFGGLTSLFLHLALVAPLVLPGPAQEQREDLVDQMVVFLVPPDRPLQRQAANPGEHWASVSGDRGALAETPTDAPVEHPIAAGRAGEEVPASPAAVGADTTVEAAVSVVEVDSTVIRDPSSAAPVYPSTLLAKNVEGNTFVHYVVDTTGRVDSTTIRVIRTTHSEFARSVREALVLMRFRPAIQASHKVRQWVEQSFSFKIIPRDRTAKKPSSP